jgi:tetratricopeptide (TPR) repeat protein
MLTWRQCAMYADIETLWQTTIRRNPNCWMAHYNLGNLILGQGRVDDAFIEYQTALKIKPDYAEAHIGLGIAFLQKRSVDEAIAHYQKALEIKPDNAIAHNDLGVVLFQTGSVDEAITHFQKALEIKPDYAEAHNNLGNALPQKGQLEAVVAHYQRAIELKPGYVSACNNLAWMLATCPKASIRNGARAVELAQRANQLSGAGNLVVLRTLAAAYAEAGRFAEAITAAQQALKLAASQTNTTLADGLRTEIKLYQAGSPFRNPGVSPEHLNGP